MDSASKQLDIPAPDPAFYPRKANMYEELTKEVAALAPIFPFSHPGAILALTAIQRGDHRPSGRFEHRNSVDEVLLCLGSSLGFLRPGQMFVQTGNHDVSGIESGSEDDYVVFYYMQRQKLEGPQPEALGLHCEQCNEIILLHEFDAAKDDFKTAAGRELIPTVLGSAQWGVKVNANPDLRKCSSCGHENLPFPLDSWGWARYAVNADLAARAEIAMTELASGRSK